MKRMLTCALCGHTFDPQAQSHCQGCPLQPGCNLVCCPACGYETVDPARSTLARLISRWLPGQANSATIEAQPVSRTMHENLTTLRSPTAKDEKQR